MKLRSSICVIAFVWMLSGATSWAADSKVAQWCSDARAAVRSFHWRFDPCEKGLDWKIAGYSVQGRPIAYIEFGKPDSKNTTLVFAMVHADEITPLYLGLDLARWLKIHQAEFANDRVVIVPLLNPDGFFCHPRTRTNARGVDLNRNFPTRDWSSKALQSWKKTLHSNPRRYPGPYPQSEPETVLQEDFIKKLKPQKILSIHAPLNFLDYDGPTTLSLYRFEPNYVHECLLLRKRLRAISSGYFPGSLGNYAGKEMGIPTLTLELPTADPVKARRYWLHFSKGIRTVIEFHVPPRADHESPLK